MSELSIPFGLDPEGTKKGVGAVEYRAFFRLPVNTYVQEVRHVGKVEVPTSERLHDDGRFHVAGSTGYSFAAYDDGELMRGDHNEQLKFLADTLYKKYENEYAYGAIDTQNEILLREDDKS